MASFFLMGKKKRKTDENVLHAAIYVEKNG